MNDLSFQIPTNRLNARGLIRHPIRQYAWFVDDIDAAKEWYTSLLGFGPYFDEPFYVGFSVGGFELGSQLHEQMACFGGGSRRQRVTWP